MMTYNVILYRKQKWQILNLQSENFAFPSNMLKNSIKTLSKQMLHQNPNGESFFNDKSYLHIKSYDTIQWE